MPKSPLYSSTSSHKASLGRRLSKKAIQFFKISRSVATHFSNNKNVLEMKRSNQLSDRFSSYITMHSLQLVESINIAEVSKNPSMTFENLSKIERTISSLRNCIEHFDHHQKTDKNMIRLLKKELSKVRELFWLWSAQYDTSNP
ncbi:hypothetical protein ACFSTE_03225 [Aquimarina hainanensis]|uniref:Four helix bundle protein n=1 Tax=Aquimarina hainanensis TaxID=1578017 RepID=A0ABW5N3Y4_9FLAO|nr:hypothetical protein [Aquimarina sp. TRL1]QKX05871.1 hypothetical protein HN014_13450 [Aquimarina sp. TRL1]